MRRSRQQDRARGDGHPSDPGHLEARRLNGPRRIARGVTAAGYQRPEAAAIEQALNTRKTAIPGHDVLVEAKLAAWPQDTVKLTERRGLVRHGAQHEAHDRRVDRSVLERKAVRDGVDDADGRGRSLRVAFGALAEVRLRLDRDDFRDRRREVREVGAVARADV